MAQANGDHYDSPGIDRVHWIPAFELLEAYGFELVLVNARDVKTVPGRKIDVDDAQWLGMIFPSKSGLARNRLA